MTHRSDWIDRIRQGDRQALIDYLQTRRADLILFVNHQLGAGLSGKIEADDIVQEVSAYAFENASEIDFGDQDPFGWFCQIAKRKVIDAGRHFNAQKRAAQREVGIHGNPGASLGGIEQLLVASITSPSRAFSRKQKEYHLLQAMNQLSTEQQKVLQLRYGDNLPTREIAKQIGKSDGATRVLLSRSLKKLEQIIHAGNPNLDSTDSPHPSNAPQE